jgi:hypothetical protein
MATACNGPAVGVLTKLLFEPGSSPHAFDSNSERYEFLMDSGAQFYRQGRLVGGQGITGKMYRLKTRVRQGGYFVRGRLVLNPSPGYLSTLLKYLVGSDSGGGVFKGGNCLNTFGVLMNMDGYTHEFKDGVVSRWILQGSGISFGEQGVPDLLTLAIDCVFKTDVWNTTAWPDPEPTLQYSTAYTPYIFQDCDGEFEIEGSDREVYGFRLEVINKIAPRWANSLTMTSIPYAGKIVRLGLQLPFDANNDDLYEPTAAGAECNIRFDLGDVGDSTLYTAIKLTNLKIPAKSPYPGDEFDVTFECDGVAFGDEATDTPEIVVTNIINVDATPSPSPSGTASSTPSASVSSTPSATPSKTPSATMSATPSSTTSATPSATESGTPSATPSPSPSNTPSRTPSSTPSPSPSGTASATPSQSVSGTPSSTPSGTPSSTVSSSMSGTPSSSPSATPSSTVSATESPSPSETPSFTASSTVSSTPSPSPSNTVSGTPSTSPSHTPSPSNTPSGTPSHTQSPSATVSNTPSSTQSPSATVSNTPSSTPSPSSTVSNTPSPSPSSTVSNTPSSTPSATGA